MNIFLEFPIFMFPFNGTFDETSILHQFLVYMNGYLQTEIRAARFLDERQDERRKGNKKQTKKQRPFASASHQL